MDNVQATPASVTIDSNVNKPKLNWPVIVLSVLLILASTFGAYFFGKFKSLTSDISNTPTQMPVIYPTPTEKLLPTLTPTVEATESGTVMGKLCYPAEVLPKGTIEAKNTATAEITVQDYPGSAAGGKNSYSFDLKPGSYYLRYKISSSLIGYHTETCKTGSETSCADSNPRVLIPATVVSGATVTDYDLCDFYYSDNTKPSF